MKAISVSNGRAYALVDDEDFQWLSNHKWYLHRLGYVYRNTSCAGQPRFQPNGKRTCSPCTLMHKEILEKYHGKTDLQTDHRDRNKLNNQKFNLRHATRSQNNANKTAQSNNKIGYKGVSKRCRRYLAHINYRKKQIFLGSFTTPEEAATAYNVASVKYFGEFGYQNKMGER